MPKLTPQYKTDANQSEIAAALRQAGYHVTNTAMVGNGFPDLLVCTNDGRVVLLEIKTQAGKLTTAERDYHAEYPGELYIVRTAEMALMYMQNGHLRNG
jgi:hypothetical protein